jgi:hypothetical protein
MTILGRGDLSPPRRHRPGRRRWPRALLVLVLLAALAAAGYYIWRHYRGSTTATVRTTPTPCVTPPPTQPPTVAAGPPIHVLNGSLRPGLAAQIGRQLRRPPFNLRVAGVGNASAFMRGASVVRYPAASAARASDVAVAVVPAARLVPVAGAGEVELDIGSAFRRLATAAEYAAAVAPSPSPSRSASAATCSPS